MKTQAQLLKEISEVVWTMESDYPEVYQYLDENPITIPNFENPKISTKELENYLETLHNIINKYKEEKGLT
ncbi:hypothetical protein [Formosa haliotis]|uniref:hypothetical protein n=1 Tax=Formosa haliotis TaxID=1555194 RepID=UPI000824F3EA|nr:hypothetical protein [Formosa haliotis]